MLGWINGIGGCENIWNGKRSQYGVGVNFILERAYDSLEYGNRTENPRYESDYLFYAETY